jgi:lipoyl(octanoyl) transferase
MMSFFLEQTRLENYDLTISNVSEFNDRTVVIKKWNWRYELAHAFQRHCLELLQTKPQLRILICCNHPHILTNGRGLQKPRKGEELNLVDFNPALAEKLPYPFFQIERGGGLTFHHPGQFIFYPIIRLNPKVLSLSQMINDIFQAASNTLASWGVDHLTHQHKLLGLWRNERKLASMGIAIERLTTFHGMALNLFRDEEFKNTLRALNPCGLDANTYMAVEEIIPLDKNSLDLFTTQFLTRIKDGW